MQGEEVAKEPGLLSLVLAGDLTRVADHSTTSLNHLVLGIPKQVSFKGPMFLI